LQRPPSAAAEDRNFCSTASFSVNASPSSGRRPRRPRIATLTARCPPCTRWGQRPPSAAAEDRNINEIDGLLFMTGQRPPSAAAEDRNSTTG